MNSKLLFDSPPVVFSVELAVAVGVTEAIILQQIHYWCDFNAKADRNRHDGHYWCYNSMAKWLEKYPFFKKSKLERAFSNLRKRGILITGNYNKHPMDRTLWYRIDYDALNALMSPPFPQNEEMDFPKIREPIPENNQRIMFMENSRSGVAGNSLLCDNNSKQTQDEEPNTEYGLDHFVERYKEIFMRMTGNKHPRITTTQRKRVISQLADFLAEHPDVDDEGLEEMAESFFVCAAESDYNINHFATPGILEYRYREVFCH